MNPELKSRLGKLSSLSGSMDSLVVINLESSPDPNFFYFTNSHADGIFYYDFSKPRIFTSQMEKERAKKGWVRDVCPIVDLSKSLSGAVGVNKKRISAALLEKLKVRHIDISQRLEDMRSVKSSYEIRQLRKACSITSKLWPKIEGEISGNITEHELKGLIEFMINKHGEPSFPAIVASGKNSRFPHHKPTDARIREPVVIDFGVRFNGYCSDMTRTVGSRKQKTLENLVAEAESMIEPGIRASEIDGFVRKSLGSEAKFFIHSLGHGIGVEVHENPSISGKSSDILVPGMVFTLEPGLYSTEGIRIEDDYLLTRKGPVCLTG